MQEFVILNGRYPPNQLSLSIFFFFKLKVISLILNKFSPKLWSRFSNFRTSRNNQNLSNRSLINMQICRCSLNQGKFYSAGFFDMVYSISKSSRNLQTKEHNHKTTQAISLNLLRKSLKLCHFFYVSK